jgi:drug/metabolite transporter (DMT)-like permease
MAEHGVCHALNGYKRTTEWRGADTMKLPSIEIICRPATLPTRLKITLYTGLALIAFAANSLICRIALGNGAIDPGAFTALRLTAGAVMLWTVAALFKQEDSPPHPGSYLSALMLFTYAIAFSFAYVSLSVATGALILFGTVQVTMILAGLYNGERPYPVEWGGLFIALTGLVYLMLPGLHAPPLVGGLLMAVAGAAWAIYSLRGRGARFPVTLTADNFLRTIPLTLIMSLLLIRHIDITARGALLAVASGALASGLGYVIWYAALKCISTTRAAAVQLLAPPIAAFGGVLLLGEQITPRLMIAAVLLLGGVGMGIAARHK